MEFQSQAGKAWSRVLIHRSRESISMSPVSRRDPSRKIHTQESCFWFRKHGNNREWHTVTTENVSLCGPREKLTSFLELEAAIRG